MAQSKGPGAVSGMQGAKARGYAPEGHGPHGGHHRHEPKHVSANPLEDHMRNNPGARSTINQPPHAGSVSG